MFPPPHDWPPENIWRAGHWPASRRLKTTGLGQGYVIFDYESLVNLNLSFFCWQLSDETITPNRTKYTATFDRLVSAHFTKEGQIKTGGESGNIMQYNELNLISQSRKMRNIWQNICLICIVAYEKWAHILGQMHAGTKLKTVRLVTVYKRIDITCYAILSRHRRSAEWYNSPASPVG